MDGQLARRGVGGRSGALWTGRASKADRNAGQAQEPRSIIVLVVLVVQ